jgi:NADH-quinone oxidoreductase subunit I
MYIGWGFLKSFGVTARRFIESYVDDLKWFLKGGFGKRYTPEALAVRQRPSTARGIFVVQYPAERLPLPERYRGFPFLVYDEDPARPRCTACGMCARVCPPQCIWIVRASDPATGKPLREPAQFHIDISICMSCGLCAEFCPFGAIKMGHDYEIAVFERQTSLLWNRERLLRPVSYHAQIHPTAYAEEAAKAQKDE